MSVILKTSVTVATSVLYKTWYDFDTTFFSVNDYIGYILVGKMV